MKYIITGVVHKWKYIGINNTTTYSVFVLVENLLKDYQWRFDVRAWGGTIQGMLELEDMNTVIDVCNKIFDLEKETTIMVNECCVLDETIISGNIGHNSLRCMIEPGRLLDKLVNEEKAGIYIFEDKKFLK